MSVAEWVNTYGIHHQRIHWSSYRKLAWAGFEPTTTEFRSDALTDWAIRPWVQLALRFNFIFLFLNFIYFILISSFLISFGKSPSIDFSFWFFSGSKTSKASTCFFPCSSVIFICFSKAFPKGEYVNVAYSIILLWSGGSISSLVRN